MKKRHPCDIHRVANKLGVRLYDSDGPRRRGDYRGAKECFAKKTLRRIGQHHGEGHLTLVLRLIVETQGNSRELYRDTLQAISDLLLYHPGLVDRGTALLDEFDRIDLAAARRQAKALGIAMPVSQAMRIILALRVHAEEALADPGAITKAVA